VASCPWDQPSATVGGRARPAAWRLRTTSGCTACTWSAGGVADGAGGADGVMLAAVGASAVRTTGWA